jgi:sugar lactone lactonase YvrE
MVALLTPVGAAAEDPRGSLQSFEVQSYQQHFGVSAQTAEQHLAVQKEGAGLVELLKQEMGSHYAGTWFNNESGEFVVALVPAASRLSVEDTLGAIDLAGNFHVKPAVSSWEELEAAQKQIGNEVEDLSEEGLVHTFLDPRSNAVVIREASDVSKTDEVKLKRIAANKSVNVEVRPIDKQRFHVGTRSCITYKPRVCDKPLRGGVAIGSLTPLGGGGFSYGSGQCTAGFKAIGNVYGNRFMLTAGHCGYFFPGKWASNTTNQNIYEIGSLEEYNFGPTGDWAKINANGSEWDTGSWPTEVAHYWENQNYPINYEAWSYPGEYVCFSGNKSGTSCGSVAVVQEEGLVDEITGTHLPPEDEVPGICNEGGDSGGPFFSPSSNTALGMLSAGEGTECSNDIALYVEIPAATTNLGVSVGARLGGPPTAVSASASNIQGYQATANGSVNPNQVPTTYRFEYGPTTAYGSSVPIPAGDAGHGSTLVEESTTIPGLQPVTSYHYRLVASSVAGTSYGADVPFTTIAVPPTVATKPAVEVTATGATLAGTVNPNGSETTYYFEYGPTTSYGTKTSEVSAGSGRSAVEESKVLASLEFGTTYHYRLVAKNVAGTTLGSDQVFTTGWRLRSNPKPEKAEYDTVVSVSCLSSTDCTGVGSYKNGSGVQVTLAEHWNGTSWEMQASENPSGASRSQFNGVSCTSTTNCVAVGFYQDSVSGHYLPLGERWNGTKWELLSTQSEGNRSYLESVSCSSATSCMAVGFYPTESPEVSKTFAEYWNGTTWTIKAPVNYETPGGEPIHEPNDLKAVSCTSSTDCTAVGFHQSSIALTMHYEALAEHWNGTSWSVEATPAVVGKTDSWLEGVSCTSSSACTAVGYASVGHSGSSVHQTEAMRWNGTKWAVESTPNVEGLDTYLHGVSCASATFCVAVANGGLGMRWNGSNWEMHYLPMPSDGPELLSAWGVSCTSSTACMAVGTYRNSAAYVGSFSDFFAKTLPAAAVTQAAAGISGAEATLKGTVNPNGSEAKYWFEYGPTTSYGTKTAETSAGSGTSPIEESKTITGLKIGAGYHFRIVASNSESTAYGADSSFATQASYTLSFGGEGPGQLFAPQGDASDSEGNVWVTDTSHNRIEEFNSKGEYIRQFGTAGSGSGQFSSPRGIAIDSKANVWVTDSANARVQEFNSKGEFVATFGKEVNKTKVEAKGTEAEKNLCTAASGNVCQAGVAGSGTGQMKEPTGIGVSSGGNLYVVETGNSRVEKFSPTGEYLAKFGSEGTEAGKLKEPSGIAVAPDGSLWVADTTNNRIEEWSSSFTFTRAVGKEGTGNGEFKSPRGIASDSEGNVWVTDTTNNRVQGFSATGTYLSQFGTAGHGNGQFSEPKGIAVDSKGNAWVVDTGDNRIEEWVP